MTTRELAQFTTVLAGAPAVPAVQVDHHELADGQMVLTCPACGAVAVVPAGAVSPPIRHRSTTCPVFTAVSIALEAYDVVGAERVS